MGLSSNQARFLALTSRQIDLEHRIQQICQRRLRLTSELENVATSYNNKISNRKMFTPSNAGINNISIKSLNKLDYKVINSIGNVVHQVGLMNKPSAPSAAATAITSQQQFLDLITLMNSGTAAATTALGGNYVLGCDIDMSGMPTYNKGVIAGTFTGTFDGQGHTISGANISATNTQRVIGFFSMISGSVKNLQLDNINVNLGNYDATAAGNVNSNVGVLTGRINELATVDNVAVTNSSITAGNDFAHVGGIAGVCYSTLTNSYADTKIKVGDNILQVGGIAGDLNNGSDIQNCSTSGSIVVGNNASYVAGFASSADGNSKIANCYTDVSIATGTGASYVGGFTDSAAETATIKSSYTVSNIILGAGAAATVGGFAGSDAGNIDGSNFYNNNIPTTAGAATTNQASATVGWSSSIWDFSDDLPTLKGTNDGSAELEEGLREGRYTLAKTADEFTQNPMDINGEEYQEIDWRATPEVFDELYKGDDVEAENKYDKTVEEINSQDKKLQLEQTTIEVEYKAISSERESVKKILDTNAQSSFKYFS